MATLVGKNDEAPKGKDVRDTQQLTPGAQPTKKVTNDTGQYTTPKTPMGGLGGMASNK